MRCVPDVAAHAWLARRREQLELPSASIAQSRTGKTHESKQSSAVTSAPSPCWPVTVGSTSPRFSRAEQLASRERGIGLGSGHWWPSEPQRRATCES